MQHMRECSAAPAAAPAVNERTPVARPQRECGFDVECDIAAYERGTRFLGIERRNLLVDCAYVRTLGVVQHRIIMRAWNVVRGEFQFRAHIDDLVKIGEMCYGNQHWRTHPGPR